MSEQEWAFKNPRKREAVSLLEYGVVGAMGTVAANPIGEAVQNNAEKLAAEGLRNSPVWNALYEAAYVLPDAKAAGLACATGAGVLFVRSAQTNRSVSVENGLIGAGIHPDAAVTPKKKRLQQYGINVAATGIGMAGAFKAGVSLNEAADLGLSYGILASAIAYNRIRFKNPFGKMRKKKS